MSLLRGESQINQSNLGEGRLIEKLSKKSIRKNSITPEAIDAYINRHSSVSPRNASGAVIGKKRRLQNEEAAFGAIPSPWMPFRPSVPVNGRAFGRKLFALFTRYHVTHRSVYDALLKDTESFIQKTDVYETLPRCDENFRYLGMNFMCLFGCKCGCHSGPILIQAKTGVEHYRVSIALTSLPSVTMQVYRWISNNSIRGKASEVVQHGVFKTRGRGAKASKLSIPKTIVVASALFSDDEVRAIKADIETVCNCLCF